jgi:hypothetical protein
MPANLNALIRYKTINGCLSGGRRRWTIAELMEKCAEALAEYRGRYETVSERTIRDDIRVMRSEMLGYNAPIDQERGLYFYSDPDYSIMSIRLTDSGLVERIILLLGDIRKEVNHPELELILEKLRQLHPYPPSSATPAADIPMVKPSVTDPMTLEEPEKRRTKAFLQITPEAYNSDLRNLFEDTEPAGLSAPEMPESEITWAILFRVIQTDLSQ